MARMTDKEADYWDELVTKNPPEVDPSKARHVSRMVELDDFTADYLLSVSAATNKTPSQIISELVMEKATVST
jgi:hypothetical protein